ncbi:MAG: arsenate reductase ArsC [Alphaproteobacteria bacterium]|nr:arsenate reductase ArsC [Alphaproteobacteria bacterium]
MTHNGVLNILVLCTGNSARSILAEGLFNASGAGRIAACSAGSRPQGKPHPEALKVLQEMGHDIAFARSKSWDEFAGPGSLPMDLIFTVCDNAAAETCPVWPGHPATVHWGLPDPAAVHGDERLVRRAFESTYQELMRRIALFLKLPIEHMAPTNLAEKAGKIATH